nr:hypothetical protein CFP56_75690 [Quercus suber]
MPENVVMLCVALRRSSPERPVNAKKNVASRKPTVDLDSPVLDTFLHDHQSMFVNLFTADTTSRRNRQATAHRHQPQKDRRSRLQG